MKCISKHRSHRTGADTLQPGDVIRVIGSWRRIETIAAYDHPTLGDACTAVLEPVAGLPGAMTLFAGDTVERRLPPAA